MISVDYLDEQVPVIFYHKLFDSLLLCVKLLPAPHALKRLLSLNDWPSFICAHNCWSSVNKKHTCSC